MIVRVEGPALVHADGEAPAVVQDVGVVAVDIPGEQAVDRRGRGVRLLPFKRGVGPNDGVTQPAQRAYARDLLIAFQVDLDGLDLAEKERLAVPLKPYDLAALANLAVCRVGVGDGEVEVIGVVALRRELRVAHLVRRVRVEEDVVPVGQAVGHGTLLS